MPEIKGNLHVSNDVIAEIVGSSVLECYGVVGLSDPAASTIKILPTSRSRKGVTVTKGEDGVIVSVYVVLQYGVNINVVTQNVRDRVAFVLDTFVQVPVDSIELHVTGIKVRK